MQVAVVGSGRVGLVASACFAELGHQVVCFDQNPAKISALNAGQEILHEDFLQELLDRYRGNKLTFSASLMNAVQQALVVVISLEVPIETTTEADLSSVDSVIREIARSADDYQLIVQKSTVPVSTNAWMHRSMVLNGRCPDSFDVVSNPEFLSEGTAVSDFLYPDRIVVGASTDRALRIMRELYSPLLNGSYLQRQAVVPRPDGRRSLPLYLETSAQSAEIIKHASNAFLATKISFVNAVANISEAVQADIEEVCKGIGSDSRIGMEFLRAGIGFGGPCFPRDLAAFQSVAQECGLQFQLLDEVRRINKEQIQRYIKKVRAALWTLKNKRLAVLGLAFKSDTDDVCESPAIEVVKALLKDGCQIVAFDPEAMEQARTLLGESITYASDAYAAAKGSDALLILTEWKQFAALNLQRIRELLKYPIVLDGRNLYLLEEMARSGLNYYSMGRPVLESSHPIEVQEKARAQSCGS